ncbi:MAG TPA: SDR family oxidoreductase [Phycisphaerales bacterium]|nr:SDR family oxidoreductase [Phycisphaerales bacterium]HMP36537.1 SDR family oxidoreductase [Phycisphaerales bacterium]
MQQPAFVVLGGSGGIGSVLVDRLVQRGWHVLAAGRDPGRLAILAQRCGVETTTVEATDFDDVARLLAEARDRFGRLDGVANCVGSILLKPAHQTRPDELEAVVRTNLFSAFATVAAAAKSMTEGGSVALCATAAALGGFANHEAIAAAKGAVIGLMRSAAATYAPRNLRVNAVAPGLVRTPLSARIVGNDAALRASVAMHALGRIGEPAHVASAIEWLLDPANDWTTGEVIAVDGGLSGLHPRPALPARAPD